MNSFNTPDCGSNELQILDELHARVWPGAITGSPDHIELVLAVMDRRAVICGLYDPADVEGGFQGDVNELAERLEALPP